ncbi:hypothetical protein HYQ46_011419 [Verticillium longisporum]|nr:hypothetical protein HYQ46_011419 [Verticillium longisporum]
MSYVKRPCGLEASYRPLPSTRSPVSTSKRVLWFLEMTAEPAVRVGRVKEVELAPGKVAHGGSDGLHRARLCCLRDAAQRACENDSRQRHVDVRYLWC